MLEPTEPNPELELGQLGVTQDFFAGPIGRPCVYETIWPFSMNSRPIIHDPCLTNQDPHSGLQVVLLVQMTKA